MCAAAFDFVAERGFIEASVDPAEILDWMNDYGRRRREAAAQGDDATAADFDELHREAEDRVVDLKAAALSPPRKVRVEQVERAVESAPPRQREQAAAEPLRTRRMDAGAEPVRSANRGDSAERADDRAAADKRRADAENLRQLAERTRNAEARLAAAEAATARTLAEQRRVAEEQEGERRRVAKERAEQELQAKERAAAAAEARAQAASQAVAGAATPAAAAPGVRVTTLAPTRAGMVGNAGRHSSAVPAAEPTRASAGSRSAAPELTPLARMFQERLIDSAPAPAARSRPTASSSTTRAPTPQAPAAKPSPPATPTPAPVVDPDADLPPLTGADLTSFRNWLAVSQRALATKFTVEQSVISKSEGKPTTVLPPQLRRALHRAMGEPRPDAGGAS